MRYFAAPQGQQVELPSVLGGPFRPPARQAELLKPTRVGTLTSSAISRRQTQGDADAAPTALSTRTTVPTPMCT